MDETDTEQKEIKVFPDEEEPYLYSDVPRAEARYKEDAEMRSFKETRFLKVDGKEIF